MPHAPRWYRDQLWLLESGEGSLSVVDRDAAAATRDKPQNARQATRMVAQLPGFTRGLDFYGPLAFIGLSQVRETATFSGLPNTRFPDILEWDDERLNHSYVVPDAALAETPQAEVSARR